MEAAKQLLSRACVIGDDAPSAAPLVLDTIEEATCLS
jgi:hypothetical protein